jgi:serine/threonine-protein kinase ATR
MRTHVEGLLVHNPTWAVDLIEYQIESASMVGNWAEVEDLVARTQRESSSILLGRVLLAMRCRDPNAVESCLMTARKVLGAPINATGARGYRTSYEAVLDLHMLHELSIIFQHSQDQHNDNGLDSLQKRLSVRLDSIVSTFRYREPVLSLRRTALALQ